MRIKMPAVRIAQGDSDTGQPHQDILTCGVCQKPFALGDINKFIQHKVHACNKENYALEQNNVPDPSDNDDAGCGGVPLAVVNTRRPSISAPIKKGINSSGGSRLICSSPLQMDDEARCSTPKRPRTPNSSASPTPIKDEMDIDHHHHHHHHHHPHHHHHHPLDNCTDDYELKPRKIKQELDSTNSSPDLLKKSRDVADAESNTSHSEPSYYICSTCKLRLHTAWRLVQHAQNVHGIKIYVETSSSSSSSSSLSPSANAASSSAAAASASKSANASSANNHSSSSSCSGSSALSGCSGASSTGAPGCPPQAGSSPAGSTLPLPASAAAAAAAISRLPLLPPSSAADVAAVAAHNRFAVGGLLGMQLNEPPPALRHHQFPSPLGLHGGASVAPPPSSMFSRPSSASSSHHESHFRMEQIVSDQLRFNQHHLAAAAAAVAAVSGIPQPHLPYAAAAADRPPSAGGRLVPPPPSLPLPHEPQLDFYSQRLRQLAGAGATSPGVSTTASGGGLLPLRKQTPPAFTSPGNSQPLPSSRSSTSPRNLSGGANHHHHHHNNNNNVSMSNNNLSEGGSDVDVSMPSPVSKAGAHDENDSLDLSSNMKAPEASASVDEKPADFSVGHGADSEEKNRECEYCGKKFRFQSNLVVHRRTHTGEKPFKCSVCNHACTQSSKLKRHMKIHRSKSNRGNGQTGGEGVEAAPVNGDGSTTSTPDDQMSNDGDEGGCSSDVEEQERMVDDDDEEAVDEEEEEEEEEDDEEEDEEEEEEDMELDEEGDEDDDGDVPEDLTTKSTSSTPSNMAAGAEEMSKSLHSPRPTPSQTPLGKSVTPLSESGVKLGNSSLVGEVMETFGLSNIHTYSEAYKQAKQVVMQDALHNPHVRKKGEAAALDAACIINNNNGISKLDGVPPHLQNGLKVKPLSSLKMKEEFAKSFGMSGQPPSLDILGASHSFFGSGLPFENLLDVANKRMKLDLEGRHNPLLGRNGLPPDDAIYPSLWFPGMASSPHPRDLFGRGDIPLDMFKPSRTSKSNLENRHDGTGAKSLAAAAAAAMNLNLPGHHQPQPHMKKESRRNDTCEYCGKVFKNCSNLTVHRRSHTGEKPYKCELCSYACAQSSKLTRHMKTHGRMGKDVYKCRFCEMPFSVPSTLEKHMRKCVVNQNMKNDNGHMVVPSMLLKCDDDSSLSSAKDNT